MNTTPSTTNSSVQQTPPAVNITRERVAKIVRQLKDLYGWCGSEFNAVCKASFELEAREDWQFDPKARTLVIASRTARNKRYRVTETSCCDARTGEACRWSGQAHWHSAALEVLVRASQPEPPARPRKAYADILADCDDLF